jgi:hypothetical protein
MQLYCLDTDGCATHTHVDEQPESGFAICPDCYGTALVYSDDYIPLLVDFDTAKAVYLQNIARQALLPKEQE